MYLNIYFEKVTKNKMPTNNTALSWLDIIIRVPCCTRLSDISVKFYARFSRSTTVFTVFKDDSCVLVAADINGQILTNGTRKRLTH